MRKIDVYDEWIYVGSFVK